MDKLLELTKTQKKSAMEPKEVYLPPCIPNSHVITRGGRKFCVPNAVKTDPISQAKTLLLNRGFPLKAINQLTNEQITEAAAANLPESMRMDPTKKIWVWGSDVSYGAPIRQRAAPRRRRRTTAKGGKRGGKTMKQLQALAKRRGVKTKARTKRGIKSALTRSGVSYK